MKLHKQIETLFHLGTAAGLSDGRLVGQFVATRGTGAEAEAAFAALVDRHGAMVLRVCRHVLGNAHDAEDAAQATFLVLARRAGSISRRESLASWLHGVAVRVAAKARQADDRRRARERRASEWTAVQSQNEGPVDHELYSPLHDELARLPESFRSALVLCYLEGLTQEQAAAALRCPLGTIQSRLARGRAKLKSRLMKRGFESSAVFSAAGSANQPFARVPEAWAEATVRLAMQFARAKGSGAAAAVAAGLAEEVLRAMIVTKLKVALGALICATVLFAGAATWGRKAQLAAPTAVAASAADPLKKPQPAPAPYDPLQPFLIPRFRVRGAVRDERGRPVAKAWIGEMVQVSKGRSRMSPTRDEIALRTDDEGKFDVQLPMPFLHWGSLHFASRDFSRRAVCVLKPEDQGQPMEIMLQPVREVHARVFETPVDHPELFLDWYLYSLSEKGLDATGFGPIRAHAPLWGRAQQRPEAASTTRESRQFDVQLPAGRYVVLFHSETTARLVEFAVPAGAGPLELPDIHLETLTWVKQIGKPAPEIDAIDLDGKRVKLADFRGKVIVLMFCADWKESELASAASLCALANRFKKQSLEILAVHDASVTSLETFKNAAIALRERMRVDRPPIHLLLDRPPNGAGTGPKKLAAGEPGSGRSFDNFQIVHDPTKIVIDTNGKLVFAQTEPEGYGSTYSSGAQGELILGNASELGDEYLDDAGNDGQATQDRWFWSKALIWAMEDQLGIPRSPAKPSIITAQPEPPPAKGPGIVSGMVVDLDDRPVSGAKISIDGPGIREKTVRSGSDGQFELTADRIEDRFKLEVEAEGLARKTFAVNPSLPLALAFGLRQSGAITIAPPGIISASLKLTPGVAVTGRLVEAGEPIPGITLGLRYAEEGVNLPSSDLQATTDERGLIRFPHVLPEHEFWVYAPLGCLPNAGVFVHKPIQSGAEGRRLDLGDLEIRKGHSLAGRVVTSDGQPVPVGATVWAQGPLARGDLPSVLNEQGHFQIHGLPDGIIFISMTYPSGPAVPAYRLSSKNKCLDPRRRLHLVGRITGDIRDLTILLEPGPPPESEIPDDDLDPAIVADYNDATFGPITGVPPQP